MFNMEPTIFFASSPNLEDLCGITVSVQTILHLPLTTLQPRIIKCREVIFTEPDVIASPSYDLDTCFNIVLQQSLFKTGRLQTRLQKQGMQLSKPYRVHPSLYQSCLRYTVITRLAQSWNRAGEWCIQGRDFLVHDGYTNAIKMNLCVNKDEMFVSLIGTTVKFPPLQVDDLDLSRQEMTDILKSTESEIREVTINDCWCHVLPSMKRGKIISLSLIIPRESPFTSYKDLKKYWKNMYGYRLPDTDEDLLYCQVGFLASGGGKHLTYPSVCLRPHPVQIIQRIDPKPILTAFLQDIHNKVGNVCGKRLRFEPKIRYAVPALHCAGQERERISLSAKSATKAGAPLRSIQTMSHMYSGSRNEKTTTVKERLSYKKIDVDSCANVHHSSDANEEQRCAGDIDDPIACDNLQYRRNDGKTVEIQFRKTDNSSSGEYLDSMLSSKHGMELSQLSGCIDTTVQQRELMLHPQSRIAESDNKDTPQAAGSKLIPIFRTKSKNCSINKLSAQCKSKDPKSSCLVPMFSAKLSKPSSALCCKERRRSLHSKEILEPLSSQQFPVDNNSIENMSPVSLLGGSPKTCASQSVPFGQQQKLASLKSAPEKSPVSDKASKLCANIFQPFVEGKQQILPKYCQKPVGKTVSSQLAPKAYGGICGALFPVKLPKVPGHSEKSKGSNDKNSASGPPCESKRKIHLEDYSHDTHKKPRAKPQIQDVNVESLARLNQLSKVNGVTLMTWLKDRGVTCRSKDKKSDLVGKVNKFLNVISLEP